MIALSSRLKKLRQQSNLTQQQLAKKIGVTKSVISAYETQMHMPSYDTLIALSKTFKVSTDYLLGNENNSIDIVDLSGLSHEERVAVKSLIRVMGGR